MTVAARPGRYRPSADQSPVRHASLSNAVEAIRVRRGSRIPVERILLVAGSILFPLGVVLIFLGWYGAAHTGRLYAQIDYLISGGLLGLGLTVGGGFMYFGYWLTRQLQESRRHNTLLLQMIERLERSADEGPLLRPVAAEEPPAATANSRRPLRASRTRPASSGRQARVEADDTLSSPLPMLVATAHGSLLHRPDCPVVAKRDGLQVLPAGSEGYGYCTMCDAAAVLA